MLPVRLAPSYKKFYCAAALALGAAACAQRAAAEIDQSIQTLRDELERRSR